MKSKSIRWAAVLFSAATWLGGCQSVTARMNKRSEAHVKWEASRALECDEAKLLAECTDSFKSGECRQYLVRGCNSAAAYRNLSGDGWTPSE